MRHPGVALRTATGMGVSLATEGERYGAYDDSSRELRGQVGVLGARLDGAWGSWDTDFGHLLGDGAQTGAGSAEEERNE